VGDLQARPRDDDDEVPLGEPPAGAQATGPVKPALPYPGEFEELWRTYRMVGAPNSSKADAHKFWKRLSRDDQDACFQGITLYVLWLQTERKKRPDYPAKHLSTFIIEKAWESYIEDAKERRRAAAA
jgi:hypothetical protein